MLIFFPVKISHMLSWHKFRESKVFTNEMISRGKIRWERISRYSSTLSCVIVLFHIVRTSVSFIWRIFDLTCAKGLVKVPRKILFTPLSSSLKIATAKLLFLKLNSSMKIPKIIQRIMRWILLVGSPGWINKYRASVISVLRITYCTFWLIQTTFTLTDYSRGWFQKKAGKMSVKS